MKKLKRICILILILLVAGISTTFAAQGVVTSNGVRMRREPNTGADILKNLHNGNSVEILGRTGTWFRIRHDGQVGYMHSEFVNITSGEVPGEESTEQPPTEEPPVQEPPTEEPPIEEPEITFPQTIVTSVAINVHIIPSITSSRTGQVGEGSSITVYRQVNNWLYISYGNQRGWVRNHTLRTALEVASETPTEDEDIEGYEEEVNVDRYIYVSVANVRREPNTGSAIAGTLARGTRVTITGEVNDWYRIESNNVRGYVLKSLISGRGTPTSRGGDEIREGEVTPITRTGYVRVNVANVRSEPTTSSAVVTTLRQRARVNISGQSGDFYRIESNGVNGYVSTGLITDNLDNIVVAPPAPAVQSTVIPASGNLTAAENIVTTARRYLGHRYVWGGTTPSGFDCSGFIFYVMNRSGHPVSRLLSEQVRSGVHVPRENLEPGDLVFFNNGPQRRLGHGGIYIGNGYFIHAANPRRGVAITTLRTCYYNTYYYTARRIH